MQKLFYQGYYPSEPIFVKNPEGVDEDDGVVLSSVVNENPEDPIFLLVLDAKTFNEIARAEVSGSVSVPVVSNRHSRHNILGIVCWLGFGSEFG